MLRTTPGSAAASRTHGPACPSRDPTAPARCLARSASQISRRLLGDELATSIDRNERGGTRIVQAQRSTMSHTALKRFGTSTEASSSGIQIRQAATQSQLGRERDTIDSWHHSASRFASLHEPRRLARPPDHGIARARRTARAGPVRGGTERRRLTTQIHALPPSCSIASEEPRIEVESMGCGDALAVPREISRRQEATGLTQRRRITRSPPAGARLAASRGAPPRELARLSRHPARSHPRRSGGRCTTSYRQTFATGYSGHRRSRGSRRQRPLGLA